MGYYSEEKCNNEPFIEHHNGFVITSRNLFLDGEIRVETPKLIYGRTYTTNELCAAVGHYTAMHALLMRDNLPHFAGYGNLNFNVKDS